MFFKSFTPLLCSPDRIRAARIYPGGDNLDKLIGEKQDREEGWFYPEAWIFAPEAAINPGSKRSDEGRTVIYDRNGKRYSWAEFIGLQGADVLNGHSLNIIVKLLDGNCTLPKEFHFSPEDEALLREVPGLKGFSGTLIKPEVWIRHPASGESAGKSYIGFNKPMNTEKFARVLSEGIKEIEKSMNALIIEPGSGLYIPGGTVHSLGRGLYFEILADGDLRVTLEENFAGRDLSIKKRLGPLYTGRRNTIETAPKFIDYNTYGREILDRCMCRP